MMQELGRHLRRIKNSIRVGKLTLPTNESGVIQTAQVQLNSYETLDNINSAQFFGFASAAPAGSDAVILCLGGDNSNPVVIGTNHVKHRPLGMASGESQIHDAVGQKIYLSQQAGKLSIVISAGQDIDLTASTNINLTCPLVTIAGNLQVNGTITSTGDQVAGAISLESHVHSGVQSGSGSTSGPIG